jgi:hypothetical protein
MRPFAIYFPQFYPTPTNDRVWGTGFTDWVLVAQANMRDQWRRRAPRRGLYDGADPAVHRSQMNEMVAAGLGGMALYHYWFYDQQELEAFERSLNTGASARTDLPWFLVWASEGWSRRWLGDPTPIVDLTTEPTRTQIDAHCRHLAVCFAQPSYFRWRGKPLFVWYHLAHFAEPARLIDGYRESLLRLGFEVAVGHFVKNPSDAALSRWCELTYLFEPRLYFGFSRSGRGPRTKRLFDAFGRFAGPTMAQRALILADRVQQRGQVHLAADYLRYRASPARARFVEALHGAVQEVVTPGWNNAPRYAERFTSLEDLPPDEVRRQLHDAANGVADLPPLINAWNEWSEGAAIEPCAYLGARYLDALQLSAAEVLPDCERLT